MAGYGSTAGISRPSFHSCEVILPDGSVCKADYSRYGSGSYSFYFHAPLNERVYGKGSIAGGTREIEGRALQAVAEAWQQAQVTEHKAMRLATAPSAKRHTLGGEPQLSRRTAQALAGMYAPCLRYASGTLVPLASPSNQSEDALDALKRMRAEGDQRDLAIGVCCRWARRWQLPRFVLDESRKPGQDRETESADK